MKELIARPGSTQPLPQPQLIALVWSGILGIILMLGLFTDYSWNNLWANLFFPPIVGLFGMRNYRDSKPLAISIQQKWFRRACCLPSMILGLPYLVIMIIAVIPPFALATGFGISEAIDSTIVQEIISPNQLMIAKVSYEPSGAYTSGLGSAQVQIVYRFLPIVKRDLYNIGKTNSDVDRTN